MDNRFITCVWFRKYFPRTHLILAFWLTVTNKSWNSTAQSLTIWSVLLFHLNLPLKSIHRSLTFSILSSTSIPSAVEMSKISQPKLPKISTMKNSTLKNSTWLWKFFKWSMQVKFPSQTNPIVIFSCMESTVDWNLYPMSWSGPYSKGFIFIFISTSNRNSMTTWIFFIFMWMRMSSSSPSIKKISFKWRHSQQQRNLDFENCKQKNGIF